MSERWEDIPVRPEIRKALWEWAEWSAGLRQSNVAISLGDAARQFREDVLAAEDEDGAEERQRRLKEKLDAVKRKARQEKP